MRLFGERSNEIVFITTVLLTLTERLGRLASEVEKISFLKSFKKFYFDIFYCLIVSKMLVTRYLRVSLS